MQKQNFTVALIAKNEAKTLPRLMESLVEFQGNGGEVILLDTGSIDGTPDIARELGCVVHEVGEKFLITLDEDTAFAINYKFREHIDEKGDIVLEGDKIFDYSSARNFVARLASNDMIAMPDCDEVYTKLDLESINEQIAQGAQQLEYNFVFSHDTDGNELIKFTHSKFYNRKTLKWVGVIHEVLSGDSSTKKFLEESIIKLEHFQNPTTDRGHYLTGLAYDCLKDESNDRNSHYFGRELFYQGYHESAIKELKRHIAMGKWTTEASQSMIFIGDCYKAKGDRSEAIGWYARAIDLEPRRREPLMKLAEMAYEEKNVEQTIIWTAAALQVKGIDFYANFQPNYENLPHEYMYWALWQKDEVMASKEQFDLCMAYQPFNPKYLHDFRFYYELPVMSIVVVSSGNVESQKRLSKSIERLNYPKEKIEVVYTESEGTVPKRIKESIRHITGEWIVCVSEDAEFENDSLMSAFKTSMDNKRWFMEFESKKGGENQFFMIHKKMLPKLGGDIFDTDFKCSQYKELLRSKLIRLGQWMLCVRAVVDDHENKESSYPENDFEDDVTLLVKKREELNLSELTINNDVGATKK